jgi:hypothetical protein
MEQTSEKPTGGCQKEPFVEGTDYKARRKLELHCFAAAAYFPSQWSLQMKCKVEACGYTQRPLEYYLLQWVVWRAYLVQIEFQYWTALNTRKMMELELRLTRARHLLCFYKRSSN